MDQRDSVAEYLFGLKPQGPKLGIDRMRVFANAIGNPERELPVIHVGGTNGKGSACAMIESILRAAGWRVGLFTSPHLVHVGERVQVNRVPLTSDALAAYVAELRPVAERIEKQHGAELRPSFFEWMTAIALLHFRRTACDIAVIEVGMGGEFDATNIVLPETSVLTSVGLDHCEWLGDTVEKIARTKAGIIKRRRPLVIGRLSRSAEFVVREAASWHEALVFSVRETFGESIDGYPRTSLPGDYQRWNAATATLAVQRLAASWRISAATIATGLASVSWAGRWQRLEIDGRHVILDASHNPDGAQVLEANLSQLARETNRAPIIVVGVLGIDRAKPLLDVIRRFAREIRLVIPDQPRASSFEELERLLPKADPRVRRSTIADLFPGQARCTAGSVGDHVVVTGSIYLLGEVMTRLGAAPDLPSAPSPAQ